MSTRVTYLPNSDADRVIWLNNFSTKIATYANTVGITSAEVTAIQKDAAMFSYIMNMLEQYKQYVNNVVSYKNLLKHAVNQQHIGVIPVAPTPGTPPQQVTEGVFDRVGLYVNRIKSSVNYTDAIGNDLGIIAPVVNIDPSTMQPDLTVTLDAGRPHIKSVKGFADAIDLYVDRHDGSGYVSIGRLLVMDYIDVANLPQNVALAEWDYKAMYVIGNSQVGLMSAVVSVVVKKQ